jgi:tetratricopeptide (TPR) repeat protein
MIRRFRSLVRRLTRPSIASSQANEELNPTPVSPENLAHQLERLLESWKETQDPEEEILLAAEALQVDQQIENWPLSAPRDVVRGALFNNLGGAFLKRNKGSRAENVECSISAFEAALHFRPREQFPEEWGQTQSDLGHAHSERINGDRAENLEQAIAAYNAALTVLTTELSPQSWATTQNNLALAYAGRIRGSRAENFEMAIAACEAALTVRTRDALPEEWAQTQNNLALAFADRIYGDKAKNLEEAIAGYERALTFITPESSLQAWVRTQNNLGVVYVDRIHGDRTDNLEKAIAVHENGLSYITIWPSLTPTGHLGHSRTISSGRETIWRPPSPSIPSTTTPKIGRWYTSILQQII